MRQGLVEGWTQWEVIILQITQMKFILKVLNLQLRATLALYCEKYTARI